MLAFRVEIDGELAHIAGVADWSLLAMHITASRGDATAPVESARQDSTRYSVGGLSQPDESDICQHFRWQERELVIGSTVCVEVVETDAPDPVIKRYRSDAQVQENPFTDAEMRALRFQDYIALKKEFEGAATGINENEITIAERHLTFSEKGKSERKPLVIRVYAPRPVDPASVSFSIADGTAVCAAEFDGISDETLGDTYGADSLQALQLATDVEPVLKRLSRKYDFYFPTGEGYFDE
jgi:hypothetical protein